MISDELRNEIEVGIRGDVPRSLLVDVQHQFPMAAEQAEAAVSGSVNVKGGVALSKKRASKATGLVRYQITDEIFEQLVVRNGGEFVGSVEVDVGPDETKKMPVFLTTGKFGNTMVGFASHREIEDLPIKNASRIALCTQNRGLSNDLFYPNEKFSERERFVLIMVRRERHELGKLASVTVSVVDQGLQFFLFQSNINDFLAGYGAGPDVGEKTHVSLKPVTRSFKAAREKAGEGGIQEKV